MSCVLMFPGQGSQALKMGKDFYDSFPIAKEVFDEIDDALSFKLTDVIFGESIEELTKTNIAQPAIMATSMAILAVLKTQNNIQYDYTVGHSLGEYSALCGANALTLSQTARLLEKRGYFMDNCCQINPGAMSAVLGLSIEQVGELCQKSGCFIANDNTIGQTVISGRVSHIEQAEILAKEMGARRALRLNVAGAFHSPLMSLAGEQMADYINGCNIATPTVPVVMNMTAIGETDPLKIKDLLIKQITNTVRYTESVQYLLSQKIDTFVEIGPGQVLSGLTKRINPDIKILSVSKIGDLDNV